MSRKIHIIAVIFVLLIAFAGCVAKTPSIVGEWFSDQEGIHMTITEEGTFLFEDDTMEHSDLLSGTYRIEGNKFLFTPTGESELTNTFTLEGDKLTLTYENYSAIFSRVKK